MEILINLINNFSPEEFIHFFRQKNRSFRPFNEEAPQYNDEDFSDCLYIGEIPFGDNTVETPNLGVSTTKIIIYAFKVNRDLTERSGKRAQYEKGKRILREKNADAGIFIFYDDNNRFRFSLITTEYIGTRRQFSHFKRFTYFVSPEETNKTFLQRIGDGDFSSLEGIKEAFSVEKVTEEFYQAYKYAINEVIIKSIDAEIEHKKKHAFAQQVLSRILFLYFLQKKRWLKWKNYEQDAGYIKNLWRKYREYTAKNKQKGNTFYSSWLSSLFFGAFNKKSHLIDKDLPEEIQESFRIMPYLNGGLFSKNDLDELISGIPDSVFEWLFEPDDRDKRKGFLETFNFTVDEASPLDIEVAVDPEMLGEVYESLIAEEERGSIGIFYTPRVEIDFMGKMSLIEYLASETKISKENIIDLIFDPHNKISLFSNVELREIKEKLDKVKIVDPAVGSASFLVGIMNVLVELHSALTKQIEGREENLFALKQHIIQENLYGVDVKDWAVMVGELRLWLSLIIETEEKYMDIYTKPLLPNLSFKIRQGDSLVEEIGGIQISLRGETLRYLPKLLETKIRELIDRKNAFFSGQRSADLKEIEEIEKLEHNIFTEILESKINELSRQIISLENTKRQLEGQKVIFGKEDKKAKEEVKKIEAQIEEIIKEKERYEVGLKNLKSKTRKDYFLWEVDFAEVFAEKSGFDIVIGNPPYVRQELIAPPLEDKNNYSDDKWRELKSEYKEKLIQSVKNIWQSVKRIDKKSDLYVYFYYHGLSLLRKGGIFCFINSNSWLDVGYGAGLQEFLLKNMRPIYIFDNLKKRSFKQADVNTVIVLIQRPEEKLQDYTIKFVALKKPFEEVNNAEVIKKIERADQPIFDDDDFRIFPKTKEELLLDGVEVEEDEGNLMKLDPEHLPYNGNKWGGKYLRAPEIYFKILEKGKGKLVRLGDIAVVRFGIKTGANEFFYLKPIGMTVKEVVEIGEKNPNALIPVKNSAGWEGEIEAEFLKPVIKSPRELRTIIVRLEDLNYLVFMCHKSERELRRTKAWEYIKWGERQGYHNRPTCRGRPRWWDLGDQEKNSYLWSRIHNDSHRIYEIFIYAADTFSVLYPNYDYEMTGAILNSTLSCFGKELHGRKVLGEGGLSSLGIDLIKIEVINPLVVKNDIIKIFSIFKHREINSIFTELGFDPKKPIREQEPNPLPDRKALDDIVFDALGLTEEERKEVYWAVAELVKNRLEKAKSA